MRVVLDTNVLISALLVEKSQPANLIALWRSNRFTLLTATLQIEELARVTRYPKICDRLVPSLAGRMINELRDLALIVERLDVMSISPDPNDDYLLAIASGGAADFLVTGDKNDLLALNIHKGTKIVSVRDFLILTKL